MKWHKNPSVTTGGKPFFYRAYSADGKWIASVVWNRSVRAYAVEVAWPIPRLLEYVSTVTQGKRAAEKAIEGRVTA